MNATITRPARGLSAYPGHYDQPTVAIDSRPAQASGSSRLTKIAVLAIFAAVAALGVEGAWLLSHHDKQATTAPVVHAVAAVPAPIAPAPSPLAPVTVVAPVPDNPVYANGSDDSSVPSVPATVAADDPGTPPPPAVVDPAPPAPAPSAPVINVVLPPLPTPDSATGSGAANSGAGSNSGSGSSGTGGGGTSGGGTGGSGSGGSGSTPNSKPSGIGTSHLKDQEEVRGSVASAGPLPGTTGSFGNTAANPGGSASGPAPGVSKFPSAAQRLFP